MAETNKIEIEDYNENNFWEKVKTFCKSIGRESLEQVGNPPEKPGCS